MTDIQDFEEETEDDAEYDNRIDDEKIRKWCKVIAIGLAGALIAFIGYLFVTGEIYTMRLV